MTFTFQEAKAGAGDRVKPYLGNILILSIGKISQGWIKSLGLDR